MQTLVTFAIEDPRSRDAQWCLEQYFDELRVRFPGGFDPGRSLYATADAFASPTGAFIVARLRGEPVGCGAIIFEDDARAYLKRMWLAPNMRGLGLGKRLLDELERLAKAAGATTACLETNGALTEAIALYRSAGYLEVPAFNDEPHAQHWFEKQLA